MPKSTKRFILSNEKLNSQGFRVITVGIDYSDFLKNPVMYWMHQHSSDDRDNKNMPIGYWSDLQINGTILSAVPVFDDSDDLAMRIYNKVEHGTIRAASIGIDAIAVDANKANWLPGQKLPTVLKSKLMEASIVDRGSNSDAVTNNDGISLSFLKLSRSNSNDFNEIQVDETPPKLTFDMDGDNMQCADGSLSPEMTAILKNSIAAGKFTKPEIDKMLSLATNDPSVLSTLKDIVKTAKIKPENITGKYHHTLISKAANNSYDEIHKYDCQLRGMAADAPELYKAKFFEKFGRMPGIMPK